MTPDSFIEYYYGTYKTIDLHGLTKEDAKATLIYELGLVDANIDCVVIIHGFHGGNVLKNLVRKEFKHSLVKDKVVLDAARTIFLLKKLN